MGKAERVSQLDKAIMGLRSLVMEGAFEVNSRLPEVALAERLDISRTPLRQAMDRLVAEGLLERIDSGGCRVASFDLDDIRDAIEVRGVIEGTAARWAAERGADPQLLEVADSLLDQLDEALASSSGIDLDRYAQLNAAFHDVLARLPGSPVIEKEINRIASLPLAAPSAFLREQELIPDFLPSLNRAQAQHRAIIEAIRDREGARAEALAREHARLARQNFAFLTETHPHLGKRVPGLALVTPS